MKKTFLFRLLAAVALTTVARPWRSNRRKSLWWPGWDSARSRTRVGLTTSCAKNCASLGYVEGKNIAFEYRSSDNKLERLPALAAELVRLKVDVIVAPADRGSNSCKERYQDDFRSSSPAAPTQ